VTTPDTKPDTNSQHARRLALAGLVANIALAAAKLIAGVFGHSYALIADAIESLSDIVGSVVVWGGLHISAKPADEDHPYGHGKAEALAGFAVAIMVGFAGVGIGAQSIRKVLNPDDPPHAWTLIVLLVVVIVKEVFFRLGRRTAARTGSVAIESDAWHHRSDAITSLAAFAGISCAILGGDTFKSADAWAALLASGVILFNAWRLIRRPLSELMDEVPIELVVKARAVAERIDGVIDVHKVAGRKSGTVFWLDMHVRVDPAMSVFDAHALVHRVKDAIRRDVPRVNDVLIHVEPWDPRFAAKRDGSPVHGRSNASQPSAEDRGEVESRE